jgi:hypothetical protein
MASGIAELNLQASMALTLEAETVDWKVLRSLSYLQMVSTRMMLTEVYLPSI